MGASNKLHNVILENRKRLSLSGVTDVDNFDDKTLLVYTAGGELTVRGKNLTVNSFSTETGDMSIEGDIWALIYGDRDKRSAIGFFKKLFR